MQIEAADVGIKYGSRLVFTGFSAVIGANEITALVGPSGSGKSSLLAVLSGLQRPSMGTVAMTLPDGNQCASKPDLVAWVTQDTNALGSRTVLDNVAIAALSRGLSHDKSRAIGMLHLEQVGLADRARSKCRELSGGELQRVALARAFATNRPFVFADEPSSSLDEANTRLLGRLLADLELTATIVVATHDPIIMEAAHVVHALRSVMHDER